MGHSDRWRSSLMAVVLWDRGLPFWPSGWSVWAHARNTARHRRAALAVWRASELAAKAEMGVGRHRQAAGPKAGLRAGAVADRRAAVARRDAEVPRQAVARVRVAAGELAKRAARAVQVAAGGLAKPAARAV